MSELVPRAPAIFYGHGSPMNTLGGPFAETWAALGEAFARPKAVVMVSAHWYIDHTAVTAMEAPRTIHDFYGFPKPLYDLAYPAPGDPWLVDRLSDIARPLEVRRDHDWGLDHGAWAVLMHTFPGADVPVVQLSIDATKPASFHLGLGRKLAELRDEGVMIAGSGDVVHNLRLARLVERVAPYDWAVRFNQEVKRAIREGDEETLLPGAELSEEAALAIPTDEHWLPLFYVLGARHADEAPQFFNDAIDAGSVSMLGVAFGTGAL
jgi:4,5-DOPA dioxygenase extradiol